MGTIINVEQPARMRLDDFMAAVARWLGQPTSAKYDGDTWVMEFPVVFEDMVYCLSHSLGEDYIAVLPPAGTGYLAGPKAAAWEPFDVRKFKWLK